MKFSKTHEWIKVEDGIGTIGITNHAQEELSDIVHVDLPEVGMQVKAGDNLLVIESVKAASDIYSPVTGEVVQVNNALVDEPELINDSAEADGWLVKIKLANPSEVDALLDLAAYKETIS